MITIKHKMKPDGRKWTVVCSEPETISFDKCHYVAGIVPPNYPVPALVEEWSFHPDFTFYCRWQGPFPNCANHMDICRAYQSDGTIIEE